MANSPTVEFFEERIERIPFSGCWIWTARTNETGYARAWFNKKAFYAHRLFYELLRGPIYSETLDHVCRVRCCINPWHLEQVSNKENVLRGTGITAQNAKKDRCLRGHIFSGDNLHLYKNGHRQCRVCRRMRELRSFEIDGVVYRGLKEASEATGLKKYVIKNRVESACWPTYRLSEASKEAK